MFAHQILHTNYNKIFSYGVKVITSIKLLNFLTPMRYYFKGPGHITGIEYLQNAELNKGLAFTLEERQTLGIHGLQAPRIKSQEEQLAVCRLFLSRYTNPINKYLYLSDLHDRNERLFYRFFAENLEEVMPIVYTPTVGKVCERLGIIFRRPRGLFITGNDRGYISNIIKNWPENNVRAIVVTDGERVLGLGDLGAFGMGIPVGKLSLYTALGGIPPSLCLPIQLDCGTNNEKLLHDPNYIGLRQNRMTGNEYEEFMDEFMTAVVKRYGQNTLIQFEDFGNKNAFALLEKYRKKYCTFNDDIQGTGAVVLGGLYASERITNKKLSDETILFVGAGEAATGIAYLTLIAMKNEGIPFKQAARRIYMCDINGLLTTDRCDELDDHQKLFAKDHEPLTDLLEIVKACNPSILIGASATRGIFTREILEYMAEQNDRPIIFALSNPNSKAECTAEQAIEYTNGRVIFSSGSPFSPVEYNGKTYFIGQGNNAYIFPGVALAVIASHSYRVSNEMFIIAAHELAKSVTEEDLESGKVFPPISKIPEISLQIAVAIVEYAYNMKYASIYPEPDDKYEWLKSQLYDFHYDSAVPIKWDWPRETHADCDKYY